MILRRSTTVCSLVFITSCAFGQMAHFPRTYDLIDVKYTISFDESKREIYGDVVNTVRPLSAGLTKVQFDEGRLDIGKVTVDGIPAKFTADDNVLVVQLPKPAAKGETLHIETVYSGEPQAGVYFIPAKRAFPAHTSVVYTQGEMVDTRYWIPTYDYPDDKATFESFIKVPKGYYALSNGALVGIEHQADADVFHWRLDKPQSTYLLSFVAGKYDEGVDSGGKVPTYYYVPEGLDSWGEAAFGGTSNIVDFYGRLVNFPYPYAKFAQAAVPDYMFGGMENTTCVTQTITALFPPSIVPLRDSTGLVAHELAHQWFGDTVTCESWKHAWLNEGFASFLPTFWTREKEGQDAYDLERLGTFQGGYFSQKFGHRAVVWDQVAEPIDLFDGVLYPGGASRLFMLMYKLGEPAFWKGMHDYLEEYKYQNANTDEFIQAMAKSSGVNLDQFEKQWLLDTQVPSIDVSLEGSSLVVKQPTPNFDFSVDVWILDGNDWVKKTLELNQDTNKMDLGPLAGKPVLVDPEVHCMVPVTYHMKYSSEQWLDLYRHAPNAAQKSRLIASMFSPSGDGEVGLSPDERLQLAKDEKSELMIPQILQGLDASQSGYLLGLTNDPNLKLADAALKALNGLIERSAAKLADPDAVKARLTDIWTGSKNDAFRADALQGLVDLTKDESLVRSAWNTDSYNDGFRTFALNWWIDHRPDEARETCLDVLDNPPSEPVRVAAIRGLGRLKDKRGDDRAYQALTRVANESSFGAKTAAINALGEYGNPAAIRVLTPMTHNSLHFIRRSAEAALKRLEG